jgi:hypothetical protein
VILQQINTVPWSRLQVLTARATTTPPNADQTDVYVGTLKVPYYGDAPSARQNQRYVRFFLEGGC